MKTAEQKLLHKGCCMKKLLHERAHKGCCMKKVPGALYRIRDFY